MHETVKRNTRINTKLAPSQQPALTRMLSIRRWRNLANTLIGCLPHPTLSPPPLPPDFSCKHFAEQNESIALLGRIRRFLRITSVYLFFDLFHQRRSGELSVFTPPSPTPPPPHSASPPAPG